MSDMISREDVLRELDGWFYDPQADEITDTGLHGTIRALPAVQPKVKPLVWTAFGKECLRAESIFGIYELMWGFENGQALLSIPPCSYPHLGRIDTWHPDIDTAKAVGQADCESRIWPALEPAVQPDAGAIREAALVAVLRECADDLESYVDHAYPIETRDKYPTQEAKYARDMEPVVKARAWIEYAGKEVMPSEARSNQAAHDTAPAGLSAGGGAEPQMRMCRVCNQPDTRYARCLRPDCPDGRPAPATEGGA